MLLYKFCFIIYIECLIVNGESLCGGIDCKNICVNIVCVILVVKY